MPVHKIFNGDLTNSAIDIRDDGVITLVQLSLAADLDADGEWVQAEVGFGSSSSFDNNDVTTTLCGARVQCGLLTSGAMQASDNVAVPMNVEVAAGERLYLHVNANGPASAVARAYVHVEAKGGSKRPEMRRR